MLIVNKAVAHPWMCDVIGHLTTRHYVAMFDDACYHFLFAVFGWSGSTDESGERGWVDVRHLIEYQAEVSAGQVLEIRASLVKIGGKSMTIRYEMINLGDGEVAYRLTMRDPSHSDEMVRELEAVDGISAITFVLHEEQAEI